MRTYSSFEEIDKDLKYLKIKRQVHVETLKLQVNEVKESFSIVSIAANLVSSIAKKAVILKVVNKLIGRKN
jgi:hypothetical protein